MSKDLNYMLAKNGGIGLDCLKYPFDENYILRKKKSIKKKLLEQQDKTPIHIAVLGGSTTDEIIKVLELFLLQHGFMPNFYEGQFGNFREEILLQNLYKSGFKPDVIYFHTSVRNLLEFPTVRDSKESVNALVEATFASFEQIWKQAFEDFQCPIIQNNFELPPFRILGNSDGTDIRGRTHFVMELNMKFAEYAQNHNYFYINDIHYQSSMYGLERWHDPTYWYMYKYAQNITAIPWLTHNIANIVKSLYGKNKKCIVLDLDNTLWGGVIGDDGVENIQIGRDTPSGQVYADFQEYIKLHKDLGVLLAVNSKNEYDNALIGLQHPDNVLNASDFVSIKANWQDKYINMKEIAEELNILPDSFVFIDDNPAEQDFMRRQLEEISVPLLDTAERYIDHIDKSGYFEITTLTQEDINRTKLYQADSKKSVLYNTADPQQYLKSLEMKAEIKPFNTLYLSRITQLVNKTNQFNLTTKRFSAQEIEIMMNSENFLTLYGRLSDKFSDYGLISVIVGSISGKTLSIDLWVMSCRVFKRDLEYAMFDQLIKRCKEENITVIQGQYIPTKKNGFVKELLPSLGFEKNNSSENGVTEYVYSVQDKYEQKNKVITVL